MKLIVSSIDLQTNLLDSSANLNPLATYVATATLMHEEDKFISNINENKRQLEDRNKPDERMDQVGL